MNRSNHRAFGGVEAAHARGDLISRSWLRALPDSDEELGQHWHVTRNGLVFAQAQHQRDSRLRGGAGRVRQAALQPRRLLHVLKGHRMCPELHAVARFLASEQGVRDESKYKAYIQRWTSAAYRLDALDAARQAIPGFEPVLVHELRDVDREQLAPAPPPEKPARLRRHRRRAVSKTGRVLSRGEREQQETRNKRLRRATSV
jgi:hypothetical protein